MRGPEVRRHRRGFPRPPWEAVILLAIALLVTALAATYESLI